jgi:hypothetical protein
MWRDTGDCATNHDISYARSRDLVHWEAGDGSELALPITVEHRPSIVDPSPPGGGLINMCQSLGFDGENRPILSYHKNDEGGSTEAYVARLEDGSWTIRKLSDWNHTWAFSGGGSIPAEIRLGGARVEPDGGLSVVWWHKHKGSGVWKLDSETLGIVGSYPEAGPDLPPDVLRVESGFPGIQVRTMGSRGEWANDRIGYSLRWETLGPNRDRPRDEVPPPSELRLYTVQREKVSSPTLSKDAEIDDDI